VEFAGENADFPQEEIQRGGFKKVVLRVLPLQGVLQCGGYRSDLPRPRETPLLLIRRFCRSKLPTVPGGTDWSRNKREEAAWKPGNTP
jgi:hypothetical protein